MREKLFSYVLVTLFLSSLTGCASTQELRKAQFLSNQYGDQVQKNIHVFSLIDARPDKEKDLQELLSNRNLISEQILNPLKVKNYAPQFLKIDTGTCGSLAEIENINELTCLDNKFSENGDLFLLFSIDQYAPPTGMAITGKTKVTGVLYSKGLNTFIWKDSVEGNYDCINAAMFGLGGYTAKLMLKMAPDLTFRSNAIGSIKELLNSVPPFPKTAR